MKLQYPARVGLLMVLFYNSLRHLITIFVPVKIFTFYIFITLVMYAFTSTAQMDSVSTMAQQDSGSLARTYFGDYYFLSGRFELPESKVSDSIFNHTRFYDILQRKSVFSPQAGNSGAASLNLFDRNSEGKTFYDGFRQFDPYLLQPFRTLPSNQKVQRFTNINFHLASKKEQHIIIKHEQHIRPWFLAGLDFSAMSSPGDFARQLNKNNYLRIWMAYESPSKVYRNYLSFTANKVNNQENGGITIDSVFENASSLNTRTLPINLRNATTTHKIRDYFLKQELNISKLFFKSDSLERLTKFNEGSLVLSHAVWYSRKSVLFTSENTDSEYFSNFFIDTLFTRDSSFYEDLFNEVVLEYTSNARDNNFQYSLGAGANLQEVKYFTTLTDTNFKSLNAIVRAGLGYRKLSLLVNLSKPLDGDAKDGYETTAMISYKPDSFNIYFIGATANKLPHSLKDQFYVSNHFIWSNNFDLLEKYSLTGGIEWTKLRMSFRTQNIIARNFLFYREDFLPQTYGDWLSFGEVSVSNIFRFGKFGVDDKIVFHYSGNTNVVKVPTLALYGSVYFKDVFFKKALGFRAGIDVSYYSSYNGYGYMPATGVFYLQDDKEIGNYPLLGVFIDLKIKTAKIFVKLDHLNAGLGERNYYGAYHYPLPGRSIKFGINWDFVN